MAQETWVQSPVEVNKRLKKWYLMPPILTLSIRRYESRVKWGNPGQGVEPSPATWYSSYQKWGLRVTLEYGHQQYLYLFAHSLFYLTLSGATALSLSGPGINSNEGVLNIPQISKVGALLSDGLNLGHCLGWWGLILTLWRDVVGVGELGWQYGTALKSNGTVTNWCTGREWPVNCMTVISAQWWSNMPFQKQRKFHILMASYGEILSGRWTII